METLSRLVRQRPPPSTFGSDKAHVIIIEDSLETVGGERIFKEAFHRIKAGSKDAASVIVCVDHPPAQYHTTTGALVKGDGEERSSTIIDCCTDPCGERESIRDGPYESVPVFSEAGRQSSKMLDTLLDTILASLHSSGTPSGKAIVGLDDISHIVRHFGARRTRMFLDALRRDSATRCVVVGLHSDLIPPHDIATVSHDTTCLVQLEPGWKLIMDSSSVESTAGTASRHDQSDAIGIMTLYIRKKQGCKKTETYEYWIPDPDEILFKMWKEPGQTVTTAKDTNIAAPLGSMKLELSEQEQEAKTHVKLPYEHRGRASSLYDTDDYRDYLPPQAGGHGPSSGPLGHILYVRDSDSEEPDSDEDPDDDLDI
ncbi:hypothetical protein M9435_001369 [Picochlorum sp. BPE23]|nr:hypothetical protein M9435_001369 [Picochlorum sp. BPE23]